MSATATVLILLAALVVVVGLARGFDARADRRRRTNADVAGSYLAEAGADGVPTATPLPRWVTALVALAAVFGAAAAGIAAASTASDATERRGDEVVACRSEYRARIDVANVAAADIESRRIDLLTSVVTSAVQGDDPGTAAAARQLVALAPGVAETRADVKRTTDEYQRAVGLSRTDPGRFLAACRRLTG